MALGRLEPVDDVTGRSPDSGSVGPMTFNDLPDDWPTRSITEPGLVADVLDLLVSEADRQRGALVLALCDSEGAPRATRVDR